MGQQVTWHGTQEELFELSNAVSAHCSCRRDRSGEQLSTCPSHQMLTREQRSLNGLLFARRIADRLRREELDGGSVAPGRPAGTLGLGG